MKQVVPLLFTLLQLKYQGKADNIFDENPVALGCLIAATCAYWLIVEKIKEMTSLSRSCEWIPTLLHAALASSLLSVISFVCIFLPYPPSLVALSIVITSFVSLALAYAFSLFIRGIKWGVKKVHGVFSLFIRGIEWGVKKMHGVLVWARGDCSVQMEQV
ncbi:hypothetical protein ACS0TY_019624 [Phlomoides rotata]